jgi:hypothetical protein
MTMRRMISMVTSQVSVEHDLGPLVVSVAAGEGFGDLVPGVLYRAPGLLDTPVLQVLVSAQRAGSLLHVTRGDS